jgi:hypothetical protein
LSSKVFIAGGLILAICIILIVRRSGTPAETPPPPPGETTYAEEKTPQIEKSSEPVFSTTHVRRTNEVRRAVEPEQTEETFAEVTNTVRQWEAPISAVLEQNITDKDKAKLLLEMFPTLSVEGQVEAAQHLSNLTSDEDYAPLGRYLASTNTAPEVQTELMGDLLNRPNSVKLPFLLYIARASEHSKAGEAKEILTLYLDGDQGTDWKVWEQKVTAWLAENPD